MNNIDNKSTRTLLRSNITKDGLTLVLAVGYTTTGEFGYFITYEKKLTNEIQYENTIKFIGKSNENSYNEILKHFKELISLNK